MDDTNARELLYTRRVTELYAGEGLQPLPKVLIAAGDPESGESTCHQISMNS
jgi:hypothetical protein